VEAQIIQTEKLGPEGWKGNFGAVARQSRISHFRPEDLTFQIEFKYVTKMSYCKHPPKAVAAPY